MLKDFPEKAKCLDTLAAFYNMRLEITKSKGKPTISAKDKRKLLKFLEKYTDVAECKTPEDYEKAIETAEYISAYEDNARNRTLGGYAYSNDISWEDSVDLSGFLKDYEQICRVVDDIREKGVVGWSSYVWYKSFCEELSAEYLIINEIKSPPTDMSEAVSRALKGIREGIRREDQIIEEGFLFDGEWHGLGLKELHIMIFKGITLLHKGEAKTAFCTFDGCDKIFIDTGRLRGSKQKYCSPYHRHRASLLRQKPK